MSRPFSHKTKIRSSHLLFGGVLSSALSSICCIGPFFFLATGMSGAWMSRVMIIEPYYPIFVLASLIFIFLGGWQLTRPIACANAPVRQSTSSPATEPLIVFILTLLATIILLTSKYWILWIAE
ncbi:MAG TPA: hypothetical protein DEF79_00885 [Gammaproteobacteria bacterium]|nr:hypothetical protein [Gammaproteobacteria bacterium]